jgi:hypothetical protein
MRWIITWIHHPDSFQSSTFSVEQNWCIVIDYRLFVLCWIFTFHFRFKILFNFSLISTVEQLPTWCSWDCNWVAAWTCSQLMCSLGESCHNPAEGSASNDLFLFDLMFCLSLDEGHEAHALLLSSRNNRQSYLTGSGIPAILSGSKHGWPRNTANPHSTNGQQARCTLFEKLIPTQIHNTIPQVRPAWVLELLLAHTRKHRTKNGYASIWVRGFFWAMERGII